MKITVYGAGQVGATTALRIVEQGLGDVILMDIVEGLPQGKGLDLAESLPVSGISRRVRGTNDYRDIEGSDYVIITAGLARKPGMSRDDLLQKNTAIITGIARQIKEMAPDAYLIMVTNPLDIMTEVLRKVTGFPKNRVMGMAGILDSARMRTFIAEAVGVSVQDVQALVLGGHGDSMVPLMEFTSVGGINITQFLAPDQIEKIISRTKFGGAEIVELLKTGSASYAPSAAAVEMLKAIINDEKRLLPVAAYLEGEYGFSGIYLGVPVVLGKNGVEKIVEIELSETAKPALAASADAVKKGIKKLEN